MIVESMKVSYVDMGRGRNARVEVETTQYVTYVVREAGRSDQPRSHEGSRLLRSRPLFSLAYGVLAVLFTDMEVTVGYVVQVLKNTNIASGL
jgi:hypothetical protein